MIVTKEIRARVLVDALLIAGMELPRSHARYKQASHALNAVHDELRKRIIHESEGIAAFIRDESVWFSQSSPDGSAFQVQIDAEWSPDPSTGVMLSGGAHDGEIIKVSRGPDGRPPIRIRVPDKMIATFDDGIGPVRPARVSEYTLEGKDPDCDRWVYRHMP